MLIGLHDAEKDPVTQRRKRRKDCRKQNFPNYALMKISTFHKGHGDSVEWWDALKNNAYDRIYSSKVFDFTPENPFLPDWAVRGGTGYADIPIDAQLPPEIEAARPDYSIYPDCDYAIGYLTRGCPNRCPWCVVPQKEGEIKPYRRWEELTRPDSRKLVLMDNNILSSGHGVSELQRLIGSGYRIDLNQGMDARLVTPEIAEIIARLDWIRFIRFSCDQIPQLEAIFRAAVLLAKHGVKPYRIFLYLLVTKDIDNAAYRVDRLKRLSGVNIYAQAERNERKGIIPDAVQLEFAQRYVYSGAYRRESWMEYCVRTGFRKGENHDFLQKKEAARKGPHGSAGPASGPGYQAVLR